ncbi:helix-hairpin-helix domain-containing protein [Rhizobium sp. NRK18]|uniref:helix-hairpin-helix domain-containing protein n=1 Tax=Rhizobium sp. NRK18 TaxID=2964667 RepID=UPI0021C35C90|nr:helix-hairpin-helix domain-containing protein [Rhizobium sp. NRK18]MCQ2004586.1 5' DNA nuclease [Rhizobium sp. NRK18]
MTSKAPGNGRKTPAEVSADDFGRAAAKLLRDAPAAPLYPLLAHPTAAMAAATAIGFGLTTQMASAFLGAMQGAFDTADRLSKAAEADAAKVAPEPEIAPEPEAKVEPAASVPVAEPAKAGPAVVAKTEKPAAKKAKPAVKSAKPVAGKAPGKKGANAKASSAAKAPAAKAAPKQALAPKAKTRAASGKADDLKQISGIGPKLEEVLNSMGYRRFADIAKLDEKAIAKLEADTGLTGRIGRDDWVGQAKTLLGKEG